MAETLEHKFLRTKFAPDVGEGRVEGYASTFGDLDSAGDIVQRGAFTQSLENGRKVRMLWQHDATQPVGKWEEVREDERGLFVRGTLAVTSTMGRDAAALLKHGALSGLSIGYVPRSTRRTRDGSRLILRADLWEVSLVTFPANVGAIVTDAKATQDDNEHEDDETDVKEAVKLLRAALRKMEDD